MLNTLKTKYSNNLYLEFILTHKCNLKCSYCSDNQYKRNFDKLDPNLISNIAKSLIEPAIIKFSGGEPTILHDLNSIISKFRDKAIRIELFSNMLGNYIPKLNDEDLIVTSIHPEFINLDKQFKNLSKNQCNVLFNILLNSKEDLPKIEKYLKHISFEGYYANPCLIQSDNTYSLKQQQDYPEIYKFFNEYTQNYYDTFQIELNSQHINFCDYFKIYNQLNNANDNVIINCNTFWIENNDITIDTIINNSKNLTIQEIKPVVVKTKNKYFMMYAQLYNTIYF